MAYDEGTDQGSGVMKQPWQDGGPSRPPRRVQPTVAPWLWKAILIAATLYGVARAWQIWASSGQ